jgi:hypothetical protein
MASVSVKVYADRGMSSRARAALIAPLALACAPLALADAAPAGEARATIRGTGNDITIVYRGAKTPAAPRAASRADAVAEATRLAAGGAGEESLIAYLRTHQVELPPIVDAEAVERLRRAGASPAVITYLSRLTALDIGETGEGSAMAYAGETAPPSYDFPGADASYPYYGYGYGIDGGYGFSGRHRSHHGGRFSPGHSGIRPGRPGGGSPRPMPAPSRSTRAGVARFRQP